MSHKHPEKVWDVITKTLWRQKKYIEEAEEEMQYLSNYINSRAGCKFVSTDVCVH